MRWRGSASVALLLFALLASLLLPERTAAEGQNSAGIVVRHGDGTLVYVWVPFEEESISGEELLLRSGLQAVVTPYGGLGTAVCSLDGEGCPSSDCFCKSFSSPAFFWHFFTLRDGTWVEELAGPSSRTVRDGDIDGWAWTAGEPGLPIVTIEEIAALNGVRAAAAAASASPSAEPDATPLPATPSPASEPTARAIVVPPGGTPVVLEPATANPDDGSGWPVFAGMAAVAVAVVAVVAVRRRQPDTS